MQRLPKVLVSGIQLPNAYAVQYTANSVSTTISAFTLNNTSAGAVTVSISIVAGAGAPAAANELVTTLSIPAAGAAPTVVTAMIGQTLNPGDTLQMKAGTAATITPRVSGYETTP